MKLSSVGSGDAELQSPSLRKWRQEESALQTVGYTVRSGTHAPSP